MKNKFKIVAFFLAIICIATISYGCGKSDSNTEITDSTLITTITASAAEIPTSKFDFEVIYYEEITSTINLTIYHEVTTDTIFVQYDGYYSGGLTQFIDTETGKPLTYSLWLEKYANK